MDITVTLTDIEWPDVIDALEDWADELDDDGSAAEDAATMRAIVDKIQAQMPS